MFGGQCGLVGIGQGLDEVGQVGQELDEVGQAGQGLDEWGNG